MGYKRGESREQLTLTPLCFDDYIEPDSICRIIAAYINGLDMKTLGFEYSETKATGRPPYDPSNMLSLYLYGYLNRIRSSRRLEMETHRNIEVMWLMEKLTPDDKTISEFRRKNAVALKNVFRAFSLWCSKQGLYGKELLAVDGTKIRANNSRNNIHSEKLTRKQIEQVDKKINDYMIALGQHRTTRKIKTT